MTSKTVRAVFKGGPFHATARNILVIGNSAKLPSPPETYALLQDVQGGLEVIPMALGDSIELAYHVYRRDHVTEAEIWCYVYDGCVSGRFVRNS